MNTLPTIISDYFRYKNEHDRAGLLSVFADTAVVMDRGENKEIHGLEEIGAWIDTSLSGLSLKTDIGAVAEDGDVWTVETIVSGDFAASPAKFIYTVKCEGDKIVSLDIMFAGSLRSD